MPCNFQKGMFWFGQKTVLSCFLLFLSVAFVVAKDSLFVPHYHDKYQNISQFYKINMAYKYDERDINVLLQIRAIEMGLDLETNILMPTLGDKAKQLKSELKKEFLHYSEMVSKNKVIPHARSILIPINLTQIHHWVGVVIRLNKFNQVLKVDYLDSTNSHIPSSIKQSLQEVYGESLNIGNTTAFFQTDDTGCGPLVVENLIKLAKGIAGSECVVTKEKMLKIRGHHVFLAEKYSPYLGLNYRQKHNRHLLGKGLNTIMYGGGLGQSFKRKVDEHRERIIKLRFYGQEPDDDTDRKTLILLMKILAHDKTHGKTEKIEERRETLYYIALVVNLLSDTARHEGEVERFRERYTTDEKSIWRDIIFLHKFVLPPRHRAYTRCYPISDARVVRILEDDFALLKEIVRVELTGSLEEKRNLRENSKDSYKLRYVYEIVNYYRELESLREIVRYADPEFLKSIDITTPLGRFAIFRILEVIGENVSKKNLTERTKDKTKIPIDWNLLVTVRNRLAHNEWSIMTDELSTVYSNLDLIEVVKDIPHIRGAMSELLSHLERIGNTPDYEQALSDYYQPSLPFEETFWQISLDLQAFILQHCSRLVDQKLIAVAQFEQLKTRVQQDIRKERTVDRQNIVDVIIVFIGEEKFTGLGNEEKGLIGNISEKLTAELRRYKSRVSAIIKQEEQEQQYLEFFHLGIRKLSSQLSDGKQYQSMGGEKAQFLQVRLLRLIFESINELEKIITPLPSGKNMRSMNQAFREFPTFFSCPDLSYLSEYSLYSFLSDVVKKGLGIKDACPVVPIISEPGVIGLYVYGDIFGKATQIPGIPIETVSKYMDFNQRVLIDIMKNYATFFSLSEELKNDFVRFAALEYIIGTIYPYLKHLDSRSKNIIPESQQLELRCLRNIIEHGNIYIDLSNIPPEQGIIRYASVYIKTIKPELVKLLQPDLGYKLYAQWLGSLIQSLDEYRNVSDDELIRITSRYGFKCLDVPKNGNCFFHAIEAQLRRLNLRGGILRNHQELRALAIQHIEDHRRLYYDFVPEAEGLDNYIKRMEADGEYADGIIVLALTRALNINLVIIPDNGAPPVIFRRPDSEAPTLYLGHQVGRQHYQELEPEPFIGIDITTAQIDNWLPYDAQPQVPITNNVTITLPLAPSLAVTRLPTMPLPPNPAMLFSGSPAIM